MRARGIDISVRQVKNYTHQDHHDFVMVIVSDGGSVLPGYEALLDEARKAEIVIACHYLRHDVNIGQQFDTFANAIEGFGIDGCSVDFEKKNNRASSKFANDCKTMIDRMTGELFMRSLTYSSSSVIQEWMYPYDVYFLQRVESYFLMAAQYPYYKWNEALRSVPDESANWNPRLPAGITDWKIWQYSSKAPGGENGIPWWQNPYADLDVFNGTITEMKKFFRVDTPVPPPPPPPNCTKYINALEGIRAITNKVL